MPRGIIFVCAAAPWYGIATIRTGSTRVITGENAEKLLTSHIHEVAGHFRRRVSQWDVVNEPVAPDDGNLLGLRSTPWLRALGPRYLDLAFHACAAADPLLCGC